MTFADVKTQADDSVGSMLACPLIDAVECLTAQLLGVAHEFTGSHPNEHPETSKGGAQTVAGPRRNARNISVTLYDSITFELVEGDDGLGCDHTVAPAAGVGSVQAVIWAAVMPLTSPSVLLIRLDAIGDALALTPLLAALRERAIPVDLVMRAVNAEIFSSRAARTTYIVPFSLRSSTLANRREIRAFGARLRENGYTDTLIASEDPGGYRLARAVGSLHRVGFVNGLGKPLKTIWASLILTRAIVRSAGLDLRAPHESVVLWELGRQLLGDMPIPRDPSVLRPIVLENDVPRGTRIAFQVSDKWERLGIDFAHVVRALRATAQVGTVHAIAASSESAYAQRIEAASGIAVERFGALTPWKEAIANAAAVVAPDSGAVHLAGMVGTPTVAIFPPIRDFDLQLARWAPWAAPYRALRADGTWPDRVPAALHDLLER